MSAPQPSCAPSVTPPPAPRAASDNTSALTRRLAVGDEAAFREFHAAYFDRLYQFLLVVTRGQEHEAQEALQETLLRVARYVRVFATEEVFWSWLKALARSAARDAGRKQRRYWAMLKDFALYWQSSRNEPASDTGGVLHGLVEESLTELEPDNRQLLEGKYFNGATVKELAEATGLTEKAVESRLLRLRRYLHEQLLKKLQEP